MPHNKIARPHRSTRPDGEMKVIARLLPPDETRRTARGTQRGHAVSNEGAAGPDRSRRTIHGGGIASPRCVQTTRSVSIRVGPMQNNGAGGNRTPVPKQSVDGLYACSPLFDLDLKDGNGHPSYRSSNQ